MIKTNNMKTRNYLETTMSLVAVLFAVVACSTKQTADGVIPAEPNYEESSQWYITDRQGDADIFYIISTETGDYPSADGSMSHYADTYADSLRLPMLSEMEGVDTLLSGKLNFYTPYYRQCSLQSFMSDSLASKRMQLSIADVRRSFAYYLKNMNQGRPFILCGFSQGALIALELMREMDDETYRRMVAAYIIGTSISQEMLNDNPRIRPAQRADDTGVTICYNSVRDASCALWPRSAFAINPVNWQTDYTEATLMTEPTPLLPVDQQKKETLKVHLDTASNLLFVSGYTATDYVLPLIGCEGNYHSREIWLYRDQLRENMQKRVSAFRQ